MLILTKTKHWKIYCRKEFNLSYKGYTRGKEKTLKELRKCVLLCANCHAEVEANITKLPQNLIDRANNHELPTIPGTLTGNEA